MVYFLRGGRGNGFSFDLDLGNIKISNDSFKAVNKTSNGSLKVAKEWEGSISDLSEIETDLMEADVQLRIVDGDKIRVTEYTNNSHSDNLFEAVLSGGKNKLLLKRDSEDFHFSFGNSDYHRVEIEIPSSYDKALSIMTASGDIEVSDAMNMKEIELTTASGDISCQQTIKAKDLEIQTSSGSIMLGNLETDNYSLQASSGDIRGKAVSGEGQIQTSSGRISMSSLVGKKHTIQTSSGDISVEGFEGEGSLQTSSGSISGEKIKLYGDLKASSSSGSIELSFDKDSNASVVISTGSGDIEGNVAFNFKDEYEKSGSAVLGNGKDYQVKIQTGSGDIDINQ